MVLSPSLECKSRQPVDACTRLFTTLNGKSAQLEMKKGSRSYSPTERFSLRNIVDLWKFANSR